MFKQTSRSVIPKEMALIGCRFQLCSFRPLHGPLETRERALERDFLNEVSVVFQVI